MTPQLLLEDLRRRGASVTVVGEVLRVQPREVLTDELRADIRALKPELVQLIRGDEGLRVFYPAAAYDAAQAAAYARQVRRANQPAQALALMRYANEWPGPVGG